MARKYAVGLWVFGTVSDRFVTEGYRKGPPLKECLRMASHIPMIKGVSIAYPAHFQGADLKASLSELGLEVSSIGAEIFADPRWQRGAISSKDEGVRRQAIDRCKDTVDAARGMGVNSVFIWPGQDGYDYPFGDYGERWRLMIDGLKEIAEYGKGVTLFLEYKPKEPRVFSIISNVSKTLLMIERIGADNLGVVMDTGHGLMAYENLAESVFLVADSGRPLALHLNDAYGYWDDDLIAGSVNMWRLIEFFYALKATGYDGWYEFDLYPYREDPVKATEQSVKFVDYVMRKMDEEYEEIARVVEREDPHDAIDLVRRVFLRDY